MKTKNKEISENKNITKFIKPIFKGVFVAVSTSLILVLVFAFILKFTNISDSVITPINQIIKGVSVFLGVFVGLKKVKEMGLVNGFFIGLIYSIVSFLIFSILCGNFAFDISFLTDMIFGAVMGAICGIICVNIKKSGN